jgi:hypothetical protein
MHFPNIPVPENVVGSLENSEDPEVPHDLLQTQRLHEPVPTQHLLTQQQYVNYEEPPPKVVVVSSMQSCPRDLVRCKKGMTHGLLNYIDTKAKCRHIKKFTCKGLCSRCLSEFIDM